MFASQDYVFYISSESDAAVRPKLSTVGGKSVALNYTCRTKLYKAPLTTAPNAKVTRALNAPSPIPYLEDLYYKRKAWYPAVEASLPGSYEPEKTEVVYQWIQRVSNIKSSHKSSSHHLQLFVSVAKGDQRFQTKTVSERANSAVWNKTFNFKKDAQPDEIQIDLCRKKKDGPDILLDRLRERLDSFEPDKEIDRKLASGATITFKVSLKSKYERLFALVIGIDKYKSKNHKPLTGCVNDILAIKSFLSSLGVPKSNICILKDKEATREAIISNFKKHLINNNRIKKDDPILFFFSGHGSRVDAPKKWTTSDGKTETVCPYDEGMPDKEGNCKEVSGIPAVTINRLFRTLAGAKGNNIVAIFDSCHSGVIARNGGVARCTEGCPISDPDLDADICDDTPAGRSATFDIPKEFVYESMSSHVLLAACKREDSAYETRDAQTPRGEFTNALIKYLWLLFDSDRVTIGYQELIDGLPALPYGQVPQSGGENARRILFDAKDPPSDSSFPITVEQLGNRGRVTGYEVAAGVIHGVSIGTEFHIQSMNPVYPAVLIAKTVHFQSSILTPSPSNRGSPDFPLLPKGARAVVSNWITGESILKVYVASDSKDQLVGFMKPHKTTTKELQKHCYARVHERKKAGVALRYIPSEEMLEIERTDKIIGVRARRETRIQLPKSELHRLPFILDAIALFRYHLLRSVSDGAQMMFQDVGSSVIMSGTDKVEMHLYRLGKPKSGDRSPIEPAKNLFKSNHARIKSLEDERYGIKIINHTWHSFFPYLFYFDASDYSITLMYGPSAAQMNAPLRAFENDLPGQCTIGYGRTGTDPIQLTCTDSTPDTGFFKLFVSTVHVDMEHIAQHAAEEAASKRRMNMMADNPGPIGGCLMAVVTVEP